VTHAETTRRPKKVITSLGHWLGNRELTVPLYYRAGLAARRAMPTCEALTKKHGGRCGRTPIKGSTRCNIHLRDAERVVHDELLELRYRKTLERGDTPMKEDRARRGLRSVAARRVQRIWARDEFGNALAPGETVYLTDADDRAVRDILRVEHDIDLDADNPDTGRPWSPRGIDRTRWSAWRVLKRRRAGTIDDIFEERMRNVIQKNRRAEQKWWERHVRETTPDVAAEAV
jgi:hypothetical protein